MGAHGTLEEALNNVAAFTAADCARQVDIAKVHRKHKEALTKKKPKKTEKKKASKQTKKNGRKRSTRQRSDSTCSSGDGEDLYDISPQAELARARQATRCARELLHRYPASRKDLRQLLWTVDQGKALDVSGIPDAEMRTGVAELLSNLPTRQTKLVFLKRSGASSIIGQLAFVFDESAAQLAAAVGNAGNAGSRQTVSNTQPHTAAVTVSVGNPAAREQRSADAPTHSETCEVSAVAAAAAAAATADVAACGNDDCNADPSPEDHPADGTAPTSAAGIDVSPEGQQAPCAALPRQQGPAMPPAELLAAAQEAATEMARAEAQLAAEEAALDLIGPPPPEIVAEAAAEGQDAWLREIARICGVLEASGQHVVSGGSHGAQPDAYEVLGLPSDVAPADVRRKYFKLSLTVHPDKCHHPRAKEAFHAVEAAAKLLQDVARRKHLDAALEDHQLRKQAAVQAEQLERARQWRLVKGTATEEDRRGPITAEPEGRGSWMTQLPVSRRPTQPQQVNITSFSKSGVARAVDSREWTETPAEKLMRLTSAATAGPAAIGAPADEAAARKSAATADAMDRYNAGPRRKTLLEQHADNMEADKKAAKKAKKRKKDDATSAATTDPAGDWRGSAPWRPFDRERDLQIGAAPVTPQDMLKKAGALSSRFGGGSSGRSFL